MGKSIGWAASGCVVLALLALAGGALLPNSWAQLDEQQEASTQSTVHHTGLLPVMTIGNLISNGYTGRAATAHDAPASPTLVPLGETSSQPYLYAARGALDSSSPAAGPAGQSLIKRGNEQTVALQVDPGPQIGSLIRQRRLVATGSQRPGHPTTQPNDILEGQTALVGDDLASAATIHGSLAQVEGAQRLLLFYASNPVPGGTTLGAMHSKRRSTVLIVLLLPGTRLTLPHGEAFANLVPGQTVQVTGTVDWQLHLMLRPTSIVVGAAPHPQQCATLSVSGNQDCAGAPASLP